MLAQIGRPEALGELAEQDEGMQERVHTLISKAQPRGPLAAGGNRTIDGLEGIFAEDAIVAHAFDLKEPAIGRKADLAQLGEIVQALADPEVIGVVDGGLGAQGPIFLVILLDARVLVIDVQGRGHAVGDDAGAKPRPRAARYPAIEDELHLLGTAEVEVLADHLFKEQTAVHRPVEHLSGGELHLQDRDIIAVAGLAVRRREGVRQQPQPFAQQGVDLGSGEPVADRLQTLRLGAAENAVVERLEGDTLLRELALGVFVAVQAKLGIKRKVAAELEEERSEVPIDRINVIVVHHRTAPHDPRVRPTGFRTPAPLGAEHRGVFLGLADKHHPFLTGKAPQMLSHHGVLALSFLKLHQWDLMPRHKVFQRRHKSPGQWAHQSRRWQRLATMFAEESDNPPFILQPRHIDVEVHAIDAVDRQLHMTADDLSHALCYHPPGSGRAGFASCRRLDPSRSQLSLILSELVMNRRSEPLHSLTRLRLRPTRSTRLVGLRRSLVRSTRPGSTYWLLRHAFHSVIPC